jgi:hypothetical protein
MEGLNKLIGQVRFRGYNSDVLLRRYRDDSGYAIQLVCNDCEDGNCIGELVLTATINVKNVVMLDDSVVIKNYSENEGIMPLLMGAGIISTPYTFVRSGYELCPVCHVTSLVLDEVEAK